MSEAQARSSATRGRGSGRGGRGGFASRGGRAGGRSNGPDSKIDGIDNPSAFDEDEGVIADLKKKYGDKTPVIKEMFPDWSEIDILFALQETDGDETEAVTRIAEGTISQWGEVSKAKKVPRTKKDASIPLPEQSGAIPRPARGGRIASEGGRGRGRATDRGGRGGRGRSSSSAVATNGARHVNKETQPLSVPTEESSIWDSKPSITDDWGEAKPVSAPAPSDDGPKPAAAPSSAAKTWASMLRQSTTPKVVAKPKETVPVAKPEDAVESQPAAVPADVESTPAPAADPVAEPAEEAAVEAQQEPASEVPHIVEPEVALPPSKDQLTETNLEQVDDDSHPPATATVASTAADSWDPRAAASANATPLSASQHQHQQAARPQAQATASSGYAASALKATTERPTRTPSYQRRILDQEEAVRMPGNREVDRAAVQFGAFNLGSEDDIDGDREEPETRTQPPAESPIAHPRTSLPPAVAQAAVPDAFSSQKPTPVAVEAANIAPAAVAPVQPPVSQSQSASQQAQSQYSRYGQPGGQEPSAFPQKPLDPFSQQANTSQNQLDAFQSQQSQAHAQQQPGGAFSSAPSEYSSYYTADQQNRAQYNYYGQPYGQQGAQGQQEGLAGQQRSYGGYNNSQADNLSQYPQSGSLHNQQSRYGATNDPHNSGHTTPNPTTQAQQQQGAASSQAGQPQSHVQQNYGYNHPYAGSPFYSNYMNYGHYNQGGYGAPYGKGGMYQPYGMSPQGPYDQHASSPASGFGQTSAHRGDSGLSSGLGSEYGRAGSGQAANPGSLAGSGFGGIQDSFARGGSSFPSQAGQGFNAATQSSAGNAGNDDLKPFGDSKAGSGPSPALGGARPGSATQNTPATQAGLPPPQSASQMGAYGYPNHQGHNVHGGSGYGMGGSGQHGNAGFGSYGGQGYGNSYYGSGAGQQQQQQQQQQQRGWGGNYH